jgi:hypothetical protein
MQGLLISATERGYWIDCTASRRLPLFLGVSTIVYSFFEVSVVLPCGVSQDLSEEGQAG